MVSVARLMNSLLPVVRYRENEPSFNSLIGQLAGGY